MNRKQRWIIGVGSGLIAARFFFPCTYHAITLSGSDPISYAQTFLQVAGISVISFAAFNLNREGKA